MKKEVVAALIVQNGKFLACKRPKEKARGGLWEFVGGKVEAGETHEEALARECREELAIEVKVGEKFFEVTHAYPDLTVHLSLYRCEIVGGTLTLLEHEEIRWLTPSEAQDYSFCPADTPILQKLSKGL